MKNLLNKMPLVLALMLVLVSCEEDRVEFDYVNGQTMAQFANATAVIPTPEEGASTTVDVLVTTKASQERSIDVTVDASSTASADEYEISNLVIPADSYVGTITINSNFSALPEQGSSFLVLNIDSIGGNETITEKGTFTVEMFRKCPVEKESLVGTWKSVDQYVNAGYYAADTVEITMSEDGDLMVEGLGYGFVTGPWAEVIVDSEPVVLSLDMENETLSIEQQYYMATTYNGGAEPDYYILGTGEVLNACENKLSLSYTFFQEGYGAFPYTMNATLTKQ